VSNFGAADKVVSDRQTSSAERAERGAVRIRSAGNPMTTGIVLDPRYMDHDPGAGHPERPERIGVLLREALDRPDTVRVEPRAATPEEITLVHGEGHFERVARTRDMARFAFDADTPVSARSFDTACLAAGGLLNLLDEVVAGRMGSGFALVRPPGHHAERDRAMGFCLFNNVAIGAAYLRARHHLQRVLVVDWDVHHGNGTEHVFARDPGVLYASTHRYPFYPGTGALTDIGEREGAGFTVNIPLPGGVGDAEYLDAFRAVIEPIALEYEPEFVLISAGFDPHRRDPLGGMNVSEAGFAAMAQSLTDVAARVAGGRCVAVLEGGYDLHAMRDSARAVLDVLCGDPAPPLPPHAPSCARPILDAVRRVQGEFWHLD
jgi:acetoin utilization deacetylase AcuC-like enzyme